MKLPVTVMDEQIKEKLLNLASPHCPKCQYQPPDCMRDGFLCRGEVDDILSLLIKTGTVFVSDPLAIYESRIAEARDEAYHKGYQQGGLDEMEAAEFRVTQERERIKRTLDEDYFTLHCDSLQGRLDRWEEIWQVIESLDKEVKK